MRNMLKEWIEGHITVTIRGKRFERLINLAVREGIHIWNIVRVQEEVGRLDILISDYFRLRPLLRQTGCRAHVERREGLPFWLIRVRNRAGFAIGIFAFLIGLYMLSSVIWKVDVQGTHMISEYEVKQAAEKVGLKRGAFKMNLKEPMVIQREMLTHLPEASWVGVEIEGTRAIVQVVEKEEGVKKPAQGPKNIVARKKAVIHSIFADSGKTMVKVNQFVNKGQVLISGIIGNEEMQRTSMVSAGGKVKGEVWYVSNVSVPLKQTRYIYTGASVNHQYLIAGDYAVHLWPFKAEVYKKAETSERRIQPSLFGITSPLGWKTETIHEMSPQVKSVTRDEATDTARKFAQQDILKRAGKDATIKEEKVLHVKEENGKVTLSIHYAVIEDIAMEQPIVNIPAPDKPDATKSN
ncbi:sporulation protein YqfD [Brevibacillus dissolubilis]|uniref:sporulation protein YqfD n=1 Tax=Brevibacillus dissolubilis TaxID=1844116 RepID=UPI00111639FE|nr:sporulation protein YqfD [Brevibacillus dissolubilis]